MRNVTCLSFWHAACPNKAMRGSLKISEDIDSAPQSRHQTWFWLQVAFHNAAHISWISHPWHWPRVAGCHHCDAPRVSQSRTQQFSKQPLYLSRQTAANHWIIEQVHLLTPRGNIWTTLFFVFSSKIAATHPRSRGPLLPRMFSRYSKLSGISLEPDRSDRRQGRWTNLEASGCFQKLGENLKMDGL